MSYYPSASTYPPDTRPQSRSRGNSGASVNRYIPDGYGQGQPQAAQSGGYLAPGPPQQQLSMPEPSPAYQPSQLAYNAPVAGTSQAPQHSTSYTGGAAAPAPGNPPYPTSAVPEYIARPADPRRYSQSSQRSHRSHHSHHSHHSRRSDDYDRGRRSHDSSNGHHHHSHHDYEPEHSHKHSHRYDDASSKPLKRADTRRPTLGDTVVSMFDGVKKYLSK